MKGISVTKRYIITDGENYVTNTLATGISTDKDKAYSWSQEKSANNVLESARERKGSDALRLDSSFRVVPINTYESDIPKDILMDVSTVQDFLDIVQYSSEYEEKLLLGLRKLDREVTDIEHFIEFTDLSAVDGFRIYKKLQSILKTRREIKHRLKIVKEINSQAIDPESLKRIITFFKDVVYKPREIDFEDML